MAAIPKLDRSEDSATDEGFSLEDTLERGTRWHVVVLVGNTPERGTRRQEVVLVGKHGGKRNTAEGGGFGRKTRRKEEN